MLRYFTVTAITGVLLASGCAWVKTTPEGEKVRVLSADEVSTCEALGTTTATLLDKVAGFERNYAKVEQELRILARNSAVNLGGDTVVPISKVHNGQQRFAVYKCVGVMR